MIFTKYILSFLDFCLSYSKNRSTELNLIVTGENLFLIFIADYDSTECVTKYRKYRRRVFYFESIRYIDISKMSISTSSIFDTSIHHYGNSMQIYDVRTLACINTVVDLSTNHFCDMEQEGYQGKQKPNVASVINNLLSSFIFSSNLWRKLIVL